MEGAAWDSGAETPKRNPESGLPSPLIRRSPARQKPEGVSCAKKIPLNPIFISCHSNYLARDGLPDRILCVLTGRVAVQPQLVWGTGSCAQKSLLKSFAECKVIRIPESEQRRQLVVCRKQFMAFHFLGNEPGQILVRCVCVLSWKPDTACSHQEEDWEILTLIK